MIYILPRNLNGYTLTIKINFKEAQNKLYLKNFKNGKLILTSDLTNEVILPLAIIDCSCRIEIKDCKIKFNSLEIKNCDYISFKNLSEATFMYWTRRPVAALFIVN